MAKNKTPVLNPNLASDARSIEILVREGSSLLRKVASDFKYSRITGKGKEKKTLEFDLSWLKKKKLRTVETMDELRQLIDKCIEAKQVGFDTEASGLDFRFYPAPPGHTYSRASKDFVCGYCLAYNTDEGYYVPVGHRRGNNLPPQEVRDEILRMVEAGTILIMWNAQFDLKVLRSVDIDIENADTFEDGQIACKLLDVTKPAEFSSLKYQALARLNARMVEFNHFCEGIVGKRKYRVSFAEFDPADVAIYAAVDPMATLALWEEIKNEKLLRVQPAVYLVEKRFSIALNRLVQNRIRVDKWDLMKTADELNKQTADILADLRRYSEEPDLNPGSTDQLRVLIFDKFKAVPFKGIKTGKKGYSTDEKTVERLLQNAKEGTPLYELLSRICKYRTLIKAQNTYVQAFLRSLDRYCDLTPQYWQIGTETGRLSSKSGDYANSGESESSVMTIPKPSTFVCDIRKAFTARLRSLRQEWCEEHDIPFKHWRRKQVDKLARRARKFLLMEGVDRSVEEIKQDFERTGVLEDDDSQYVVVKIDYAGQELRIWANLADEDVWIELLNNYEDLHRKTASLCFNLPEDQIDKIKRNEGKTTNFAVIYGAAAQNIAEQYGVNINEGQAIVDRLFSELRKGKAWIDRMHITASQKLYTKTKLGRIRLLPEAASPRMRQRSQAMRQSANTPVQGTGGDVLKIVAWKLYRLFEKMGWHEEFNEDVYYWLTVHDELVFSMRRKKLSTIIKHVMHVMEEPIWKDWKVKLKTEANIDATWSGRNCYTLLYEPDPDNPDNPDSGILIPEDEYKSRQKANIEAKVEGPGLKAVQDCIKEYKTNPDFVEWHKVDQIMREFWEEREEVRLEYEAEEDHNKQNDIFSEDIEERLPPAKKAPQRDLGGFYIQDEQEILIDPDFYLEGNPLCIYITSPSPKAAAERIKDLLRQSIGGDPHHVIIRQGEKTLADGRMPIDPAKFLTLAQKK
jgi:DNA polymerase I-like protein with 3'-5' exonuclease and polymerase domains